MEKKYKFATRILSIMVIAGLVAWIYQLQKGLILTNMRNPFTWGLYIATWAFFVGTAAGGLVVSSAIYVFGAKEFKPIAKVASLTAFVCVIGAMLSILPDIGRPERLYYMIISPNLDSMLPWDVLVLVLYALVSGIYTYILLKPDIASRGIKLPLLGTVLKREVSKEEIENIREKSEIQAKRLAPIALPLAIMIHTVTAWVLATQFSRAWWYGGLLAPTFIAAALATGPAVVIIASMIVYGYKNELLATFSLLAKFSAISAVILLFMYYNDFLVRFWWRSGREFEVLKLVFSRYPLIHAIEIIFILASVIIFATRSKSRNWLIAGSISVLVGVFAHRFLLIPPAYNQIPLEIPVATSTEALTWFYPIAIGQIRGSLLNPQDVFTSFWNYVPSIVEITITTGVIAFVCLAYMLSIRALPLIEETR